MKNIIKSIIVAIMIAVSFASCENNGCTIREDNNLKCLEIQYQNRLTYIKCYEAKHICNCLKTGYNGTYDGIAQYEYVDIEFIDNNNVKVTEWKYKELMADPNFVQPLLDEYFKEEKYELYKQLQFEHNIADKTKDIKKEYTISAKKLYKALEKY